MTIRAGFGRPTSNRFRQNLDNLLSNNTGLSKWGGAISLFVVGNIGSLKV
ncbi:hypothetical protein HSBAA_29470 [Vreelandella sulfidaeris]|uniref:Uncharacterized protein n=1 Tax=Vreelandella sulfidaeris TaxID=115553 RepID=A0A455UAP7_9GAMM|nr:hypothetical protein HSBAA_29470 [Halomonas sulfidaeris]